MSCQLNENTNFLTSLNTMPYSTIDNSQGMGTSGTKPFLKKQIPIKSDKLDNFLLAQVAWCTVPALLLVRLGLFQAGSLWCFIFLIAFLTWYGLKRNIPAFVALTVASLPALVYTRTFFLYNSILVLLALGLVFWLVRFPKECLRLWDNHLIRWFFIMMTVYWGISVILTRLYYSNLSVMEMFCSAASIYLLARHQRYLATALAGLGISIFSVAIGMIGQSERLGMFDIDGVRLGNPLFLGLPTALFLLLAMADNGKWLFLERSNIVRNTLIAMCGVFLLLSTSRSSWLVVFVGIVVTVFFQSQQRWKVFFGILLMGCVLVGVLQTKSGEKVSKYFEMATDSQSTFSEKTSGRGQQWQLFPKILADSPIWGVGPGLGTEAYASYSWMDKEVTFKQGQKFAWHSIYMQVGVETGLIGLTILTIFLIKLIFKTLLYRKITRNVVPLAAILGFIMMGVAGHMLEGLSGLYLGLAFLGTTFPQKTHRDGNSSSP
ncbi:MAG TPA: O-antigen ligase family protein [Nitrospirales bacterium]|nr:hypothetical protein [Nitrospiraceae bacterium]HNP28719.1 O-antigen ligase family protein [Nitrospirales bacterium]